MSAINIKPSGHRFIDWREAAISSDLPANAKYLVLYLATFMNGKRDVAWPSQSRIIRETGLSNTTVNKYLSVLEQGQWLVRDKGNSRRTTRYMPAVPDGFLSNILSPDTPRDGEFKELDTPPGGVRTLREAETNRQVNRQITTTTTARARAREATKIDSGFKPDEQDYQLLARKGISRQFIDEQLPEFIAFWQESGAVSATWRAKFRNRVTSLFYESQGWSSSSGPGNGKSRRGSYETRGTSNRHESGLQRADRICFDGITKPF